ncbi:MAG: aldehyde oxidase and xanthine dehydrogenase molybdopterin binding protein [Myxococcaceae bacterium]|nr:aldehyde oxidase and xanthine dehydrogenase molybdopterin binding protein [Myxococcaceae bacterium]
MSGLSRRGLLQAGAAIGGGLTIGVWLPTGADAAVRNKPFAPNAWIRVLPDDRVQFVLSPVEMGQGVVTSHAMLVAEELMVAPQKLECVFAEANRAYDNPAIGYQVTGGSTSVKTAWLPLRTAAATAREMLIAAGARTWQVDEDDCFAEEGAVVHRPTGRRLRYGALTQNAARPSPGWRTWSRSPPGWRWWPRGTGRRCARRRC